MIRNRRRRITHLLGCTAAALALITTAACSGETSKVEGGSDDDSGGGSKTVKLAYVAGWDEGVSATFLWKQILEDKGYKVEVRDLDIASTYAGIANKQVDVYMDAWLPVTHETYWKKLGPKMEKVGTWYEPADLNLTVPKYVKDVNTIDDLKGKSSEFGGKIVGIEAGSGLMRLTRSNVLPDYGLKSEYELTESSTSAMLSALQKGINAKKPVLVTLWRPHWAYTKMPLKVLKDTKKSYGKPDKVQIVASKGYSSANPKVAGWLKNFRMNSKQLGSLELLLQKKGTGNEQAAAKEWMADNKQLVDSWLK
ncbi:MULTISPECIES: glycine betaine ABC transporter substrate-binding protein [unclassified Streptomyces]|uniref:glycine betaine ABC transporter substrate-binding protein n=1 Tax=unclassified Streptomyces TaxID=2593676 RepID=UPI00278C69E1|nr:MULTISPECIES: glycine betaine ABC transporter substrate-binding protein [unclassified Streptomyces]